MLNNSKYPFEAVLWDMDGTLVDTEPIWINEERELMQSLGYEWDDEDAKYCIGGPMSRVDEYMRAKTNYKYGYFELTEILIKRMVDRLSEPLNFAAGALALLKSLNQQSVPMALVSASPRPIVDRVLKTIQANYFATTISNDDVNESKPAPEGYLKAARHLSAQIENCLVIEDSITGVRAAMDSGAYVLAIPHVLELPDGPKTIQRLSLDGLSYANLPELFQPILAR